jgi:hypothetical protein
MIVINECFTIKTEHFKGTWEDDETNDYCDFELVVTTNNSYGLTQESVIVIASEHYKQKILNDWNL